LLTFEPESFVEIFPFFSEKMTQMHKPLHKQKQILINKGTQSLHTDDEGREQVSGGNHASPESA
jgi:hypothetical protein